MTDDYDEDESEKRPKTCWECAWRNDDDRCVHGNGPRTGTYVARDELSCHAGKPREAFCVDPTLLDMPEDEFEKHMRSDSFAEINSKLHESLRRQAIRNLEKAKEGLEALTRVYEERERDSKPAPPYLTLVKNEKEP